MNVNVSDTDELSDILQTFLGYPDVISGLQSGDVEGCAKGKCTFCTNVMKLKGEYTHVSYIYINQWLVRIL